MILLLMCMLCSLELRSCRYSQYPGPFLSSDCLFRLLFSCLILNTDLHNPGVKNKMTLEGFLRNNEGINNDENLPVEYRFPSIFIKK